MSAAKRLVLMGGEASLTALPSRTDVRARGTDGAPNAVVASVVQHDIIELVDHHGILYYEIS